MKGNLHISVSETQRFLEVFFFVVSENVNSHKTRHYGTQNVIYVKALYTHDNSLGQAVPGAANLANEVIGRCQG